MALKILHPGLFSTVQDLGRTGYRSWGVPLGGTFDSASAAVANALLGNATSAAVVEMTMTGGSYEAIHSLALALAGAPMKAKILRPKGEDQEIRIPSSFTLRKDERLVIRAGSSGVRTYLAVRDGWQTPIVLGSRSSETPLKAGDVLPASQSWTPARSVSPFDSAATNTPIRVVDGLDSSGVLTGLLSPEHDFIIAPQCDRTGLRLEGPPLKLETDFERISTPVAPGAIQLAGEKLLILGVACGTMGGYPHIAHVISPDLDRLAQVRPGDSIRFVRVTVQQARHLNLTVRKSRAARLLQIVTAVGDSLPSECHFNAD